MMEKYFEQLCKVKLLWCFKDVIESCEVIYAKGTDHSHLDDLLDEKVIQKITAMNKQAGIIGAKLDANRSKITKKWSSRNYLRYTNIPWVESAHIRLKPWNEQHAYWIN